MSGKTANILPLVAVNDAYSYKVPAAMADAIQPGIFVVVPLRGQQVSGIVMEIAEPPAGIELKEISEILDTLPVLDGELIELSRWIAEYYLAQWGEVVRTIIPKGIERRSARAAIFHEHRARELPGLEIPPDALAKVYSFFSGSSFLSAGKLGRLAERNAIGGIFPILERNGIIEYRQTLLSPRVRPLMEDFVILSDTPAIHEGLDAICRTAPRQAEILKVLLKEDTHRLSRTELLRRTGSNPQSLRALMKKGFITVETKEKLRQYPGVYEGTYFKPESLTPYQEKAISEIRKSMESGGFKAFLLHGVTASGKTQVYIEAIKDVVARGKGVIFLVPEISLTSHAVMRLNAYFEGQTAFLHSNMSEGERFDAWRLIRAGEKKIVIGPRSAVFAPVRNLGLLIVDEEHEESYKQSDSDPRYNARDVAVVRARLNACPVVLGSATPSMESYYNAVHEKYTLLSLPQRVVDIPLPKVKIVNLIREPDKKKVFSRYLLERIKEHLFRGEQVILLQNRRGFSTIIQCHDCGFIEQCRHCSIALTYHKRAGRAICHYCGFTKPLPVTCENCRGLNLFYGGAGTQRVEEELREALPEISIIRMDRDTTTTKGSHEEIAGDFEKGNYQVLLGTQMIAKGFDFPNVNLVGVISADTALSMPDFRASERTFQLLTQVAGRAGRRKIRGQVVIQTYLPKNQIIQCALSQDYFLFYNLESQIREPKSYPPFGKLISIVFKGESENQVVKSAQVFSRLLEVASPAGKIYGPVPCPLARLKDKFRWQILVKGEKSSGKALREWVARARDEFRKTSMSKKITLGIDVDPLSIL